MQNTKKEIKFPENLRLKQLIEEKGQSVAFVAKKIGYSRVVVSNTVNGHYKGTEVIPLIEKHLNPTV